MLVAGFAMTLMPETAVSDSESGKTGSCSPSTKRVKPMRGSLGPSNDIAVLPPTSSAAQLLAPKAPVVKNPSPRVKRLSGHHGR